MDKLWCVMIITGIILLLEEHFHVIVIPEILKQIHLIRTGIGFLLVEAFYMSYYGLWNDEEGGTDEHLDE
jgi:hypothetical protein